MPCCRPSCRPISTRLGWIGLALIAGPSPLAAQHEHRGRSEVPATDPVRVGSIVFPNSGARAAQPAFLRGVALLHSFSYEQAAAAFREAQRRDPSFALAHWGEALAQRMPQGWGEDTLAARAVLARLGATPAARAAKARTPRERAYIAAVETLFGADGDTTARDVTGVIETLGRLRIDSLRITRYAEAMRRLHRAYPDDDEAAAFYAHALMNRRNLELETLLRTSVEMAAAVEDLFRRNPDHPGAAHFLIHAYDDARLAPLGLRAARAYARIAPTEQHAQHMPSHIFFQLGLWSEAVTANERAFALVRAEGGTDPRAPYSWDWHPVDFLQHALIEAGRWREAKAIADTATALLTPARLAVLEPDQRNRQRGLRRFARKYAMETTEQADEDSARWTFPSAAIAYRKGDRARLDTLPRVIELDVEVPQSLREHFATEARAYHLALDGQRDSAVTMLRRDCAARYVGELVSAGEGPRSALARACQIAGEILLEAGRAREAVDAYDDALRLAPGYWRARLGRARALTRVGDAAGARAAYAELLAQWSKADLDLPALAEVKAGAAP
jgi:tetratricopeptide (TPR) repeat protein